MKDVGIIMGLKGPGDGKTGRREEKTSLESAAVEQSRRMLGPSRLRHLRYGRPLLRKDQRKKGDRSEPLRSRCVGEKWILLRMIEPGELTVRKKQDRSTNA